MNRKWIGNESPILSYSTPIQFSQVPSPEVSQSSILQQVSVLQKTNARLQRLLSMSAKISFILLFGFICCCKAPTPFFSQRALVQTGAPVFFPTSQPSPKPTPEPTPYYGCVCCLDSNVHGDNREACYSNPPDDPDYCVYCCGYPASDINDDLGSPKDCALEAEKNLRKIGMTKICSCK